jgi:predicted hydrocarbon binding protein
MVDEPQVLSKSFRAFLLGVQDVVGESAMPNILRQAQLEQYIQNYPSATAEQAGHLQKYISQINHVLFDIYGARGCRAILSRVGRVQALEMMTQDAKVTNLVKTAFKLAPQHVKVKLLLDRAAQEIGTRMNTSPKVTQDGAVYIYDDPTCPYCIDWAHATPVCFTVAGFLGQVLQHIGEIQDAKIEEIACRSKGDASCRFRVTVG